MPILDNPRHERFAQALASGKSADDAYAASGFKPDRGNASRLTAKDNVRQRIVELQVPAAAKSGMTVESLIEEAERIQHMAERLDNPNAAVAALTAKAKLGGMWVERAINENRNENYVVGDKPATDDEWAAEHNATH